MQKNFLKIFLTAIFCLIISCRTHIREPYMISNFQNIQTLETADHNFCNSLNLDSGQQFYLNSEVYWHCRLSLAKSKLRIDENVAENVKFNFQINDLVSKISLDLSEKHESEFIREIRKMGDHQHRQCVRLGFDPDTLDKIVIDDYFLCRKRLIDEQDFDPAFGNIDYLEHPNRTYNIGFVVDRRLDIEDKKIAQAAKEYPTCVKYNLRKGNFKRCSAAQDNSRACFSLIAKKKLKKEAIEKTICQKQSYVEFPNSFLDKEDSQKLHIREVETNADVVNQNTFKSLGISESDIEKFQSAKDEKVEEQKKEEDINSKKGLYSKTDLTRLRQRYIYACHKEADIYINEYEKELKKECEELVKFEELDE